jgi:proline dehydrogenase
MISFDNTENAFKSKTNKNLKQSYWLFKLIGNPTLVNFGAAFGPLSLKIGFKGLIKNTIFKQFVGGESISDCSLAIEQLSKFNIGTILDYSVEGKESETDFENCFNETIRTIEKAYTNKNIPFCVFKVTGLARFALLEKVSSNQNLTDIEKTEWQNVERRVNKICETAANKNQAIFIDAEESWIQPAIDELANKNMANYNKENVIVYNTYQLYRHDRLAYLKQTLNNAIKNNYKVGAKLVRGAYMEKERKRAVEKNYTSPIQINKQNSDNDYNEALNFCIENLNNMALCAGTHNEESSLYLVSLMQKQNITSNDKRIYFSQLYGMSDHISYNLSLSNYNVVKYVPYGPVNEVLPYLIRRAQENTSVKGQTGRELNLILKEKKRRGI